MAKIIMVDDDVALCGVVKDWLESQGHTIETVFTGRDGEDFLTTYKYDLIILDWTLPDLQGVDICGKMRRTGLQTPILMLTGKTHIDDKEKGLDSGADDYLTKPFDLKEPSARVRAILRRPEAVTGNLIVRGELRLDTSSRKFMVGDKERNSTPEILLCSNFSQKPSQSGFSKRNLVNRVWSADATAGTDTVRTAIKRLRQQLESVGLKETLSTVYGVGYQPGSPLLRNWKTTIKAQTKSRIEDYREASEFHGPALYFSLPLYRCTFSLPTIALAQNTSGAVLEYPGIHRTLAVLHCLRPTPQLQPLSRG
ncbi:MAG: response regulator transcription factor [Candidatus Obscuribacterales bacterium]